METYWVSIQTKMLVEPAIAIMQALVPWAQEPIVEEKKFSPVSNQVETPLSFLEEVLTTLERNPTAIVNDNKEKICMRQLEAFLNLVKSILHIS